MGVMLQNNLMSEIGLDEKPALIYSDNMGAIFIVHNKQVSNRTKHIDIRHHFIREARENGQVEVEHVPGEDNASDVLTKNPSVSSFKINSSKILNGSIFTEGECHISVE